MRLRTTILYKTHARTTLQSGINKLSKAVGGTLGPRGRNVVIGHLNKPPRIINDGVSIAKKLKLRNKLENTGVSLLREAAIQTNHVVGDGTTTSIVVAQALVNEGLRMVSIGINPMILKSGLEEALEFTLEEILVYTESVENFSQIAGLARISAGSDSDLSELLTSAIQKVGIHGLISIEKTSETHSSLIFSDGIDFKKGYISRYFIPPFDPTAPKIILRNPYLLLVVNPIKSFRWEIKPILNILLAEDRSMLIICKKFVGPVLTSLLINTIQNIVNVVVVRAPGLDSQQQSFLADVAEITGGTLVSLERGVNLAQIKIENFGTASKAMVSKEFTTIIPSLTCQKNLLSLSQTLRRQIELGESSTYEIDEIKDRLKKLAGGLALIRVGGMTETEIEDRTLRIEDAMNATYAGVEAGSVPGGGNLLYFLACDVEKWGKTQINGDEFVGASILVCALKAPFHKIIRNSGKNIAIIEEKINEFNADVSLDKSFKFFKFGYNAETDEIVDLQKLGIIDPYLVAVTALKNAVSIASMVITTEGLVVQEYLTSKRRN